MRPNKVPAAAGKKPATRTAKKKPPEEEAVSGEPPADEDRPELSAGCVLAFLSPIAAGCASLLCVWTIGASPLSWLIVLTNGVVAAAGPMVGAMMVDDPLPTRLFGVVTSGIGGLAVYCIVIACAARM